MKKSTLISTLAMVVIVALALTTATFAWYTANSTVTATSNVTAAASSSTDLTIGEAPGATETNYPIPTTGNTGLMPAAPTADWTLVANQPADLDAAVDNLQGAILNPKTNKFDTNGNKVNTYKGEFYVTNRGSATSTITPKVSLTATPNVTANPAAEDADAEAARVAKLDASNMLRVAVFVDGTYVGTLCNKTNTDTDTVFGEIKGKDEGDDATISTAMGKYTADTEITLSALAGGNSIHVEFVAWLDGALLNTPNQNASCDFTFTFA